MSKPKGEPVTVFYDGACPLCQAEIAHYKKRDRDRRLHLVDVSDQSFAGDARLSRAEASSRFHIRTADGQQFTGARVCRSMARNSSLALAGKVGAYSGCDGPDGAALPPVSARPPTYGSGLYLAHTHGPTWLIKAPCLGARRSF